MKTKTGICLSLDLVETGNSRPFIAQFGLPFDATNVEFKFQFGYPLNKRLIVTRLLRIVIYTYIVSFS